MFEVRGESGALLVGGLATEDEAVDAARAAVRRLGCAAVVVHRDGRPYAVVHGQGRLCSVMECMECGVAEAALAGAIVCLWRGEA